MCTTTIMERGINPRNSSSSPSSSTSTETVATKPAAADATQAPVAAAPAAGATTTGTATAPLTGDIQANRQARFTARRPLNNQGSLLSGFSGTSLGGATLAKPSLLGQ